MPLSIKSVLALINQKDLEKIRTIHKSGKKLTPFLEFYMNALVSKDLMDQSVQSLKPKTLTTSKLFKEALKALNHKEVTEKALISVYKELKIFLQDKASPLTLLKTTLMMVRELDFIKTHLDSDQVSLQSHVLERQLYLFLGLLYLELFGSKETVSYLEPFFEKDSEHPYVLETDGYEYSSSFSKFMNGVNQAFKDYQGISESLKRLFRPIRYEENVTVLNDEILAYNEHFETKHFDNGETIRPMDYYLEKKDIFKFDGYLYETMNSIKYMRKTYYDKDSYVIMSPVLKTLIETDLAAKPMGFAKKHEITYVNQDHLQNYLNEEDEPLIISKANIFQLGDTYFIQRGFAGPDCRYCMYIYPLSNYSTKDIKDLYHPTLEELTQLVNRVKHIFRMGGI